MRIDIISVLPELIESPFNASILKRAIDKQIIEICFHDLKKYASNKRKQVESALNRAESKARELAKQLEAELREGDRLADQIVAEDVQRDGIWWQKIKKARLGLKGRPKKN